MNQLILPFLVASTVIMLIWGLYQVIGGLSDERKKLQQRLTHEGKSSEGFDPATLTVVRRQQEIGGFSGGLARLPYGHTLAHRLAQTWPSVSLAKFLFITLGLTLVGFFTIFMVTASTLLGSACGVVFAFAPLFLLNNGRNRKQREFLDQLPEALDFLSRILRAGHSLSTGLQMMADELPQPLSGEFRRCYDAHSVGQSLEDALKDTAIRVDNPDFGFFVTAILIQRQTGGDLSEVLDNISDMIRQRIRLQQHVKAKTAEGRFTGYILVVFPVILFFVSYYLNPSYASVLLHTSTGLMLLGIAAGMLFMGTWAIRKITTIKV
ncbi:MAG TPA: type II secretion system F family protein [Tepidisphaeraceae bacterium]|jgi:tight adherence protein B|nr:type II secretion system F family protein [Tepidisphaeraceae bacterium]